MEKAMYMQIDRIESKIDRLDEGMKIQMKMGSDDFLLGFYETEILADAGALNHLKNDQKVMDFFKNLSESEDSEHISLPTGNFNVQEEEEDIDEEPDEEETFGNKPLRK